MDKSRGESVKRSRSGNTVPHPSSDNIARTILHTSGKNIKFITYGLISYFACFHFLKVLGGETWVYYNCCNVVRIYFSLLVVYLVSHCLNKN